MARFNTIRTEYSNRSALLERLRKAKLI